MKRIAGRAIIIENDEVILIYRRRLKKDKIREYYAIPGGGQESGETILETIKREIKEELSLNIEPINFLGTQEDKKTINYIYDAYIINGTLALGGEELANNNENNYYEIRKIKISELDNYDILEENKQFIKIAYENYLKLLNK